MFWTVQVLPIFIGELQLRMTVGLMPSFRAASSVNGLNEEPAWNLLVVRLIFAPSRSVS